MPRLRYSHAYLRRCPGLRPPGRADVEGHESATLCLCLAGARRGEGRRAGLPPSKPRGVPRARPPAAGPGCPFKRPQRRVNRCAWLLPSPPLPQRCDSGRRRSRAARWAAAGSRCRAEGAPAGPPGARVPSGSAAELAAGRAAASAAPRGGSGERVRPEDSTIAGRRRQGKGQGERRREKEKAQHGGWRGEDGAEDSRAWLR